MYKYSCHSFKTNKYNIIRNNNTEIYMRSFGSQLRPVGTLLYIRLMVSYYTLKLQGHVIYGTFFIRIFSKQMIENLK